MTNFVKKLTFHRSANKLSFSGFCLQKRKRGTACAAPLLFWLIPSPRYLPKNLLLLQCQVLSSGRVGSNAYCCAFRQGSGAAKIVVDELKRTTASGLEQ